MEAVHVALSPCSWESSTIFSQRGPPSGSRTTGRSPRSSRRLRIVDQKERSLLIPGEWKQKLIGVPQDWTVIRILHAAPSRKQHRNVPTRSAGGDCCCRRRRPLMQQLCEEKCSGFAGKMASSLEYTFQNALFQRMQVDFERSTRGCMYIIHATSSSCYRVPGCNFYQVYRAIG